MDRLHEKRIQVLATIEEVAASGGLAALRVGQVMTSTPNTISAQTTVLDLVRQLKTNGFRHLLVTDPHGRLLGVVSDRDVIRCFGPADYPDEKLLASIHADRIMSSELITVGTQTSLERAVKLMIEYGISCLPVMRDEQLVGIITNTDLFVVLQLLLQRLGSVPEPQNSEDESIAAR